MTGKGQSLVEISLGGKRRKFRVGEMGIAFLGCTVENTGKAEQEW